MTSSPVTDHCPLCYRGKATNALRKLCYIFWLFAHNSGPVFGGPMAEVYDGYNIYI